MSQPGRGFTLVELVIVIAIVAILAAIALPAYTGQVRKSNRAVGKSALSQMLQREEAFMADRKRYGTALTDLGLAATLYACKDGNLDCTAANGIYAVTVCNAGNSPGGATSSSGGAIACADPTTTVVWLKATPINQQATDLCGTLVVNTIGIKGQNGAQGVMCWKS